MNYSRKVTGSAIPMNPHHKPTSPGSEAAYYEELTGSSLQNENLYTTTNKEFVPAADITSIKSAEKDKKKKEQRVCCNSKGCLCFCLVILFAFSLTATACIVLLFLEIESIKSNVGHETILQELQETVAEQCGHEAILHNISELQAKTFRLNISTDSLQETLEQLTITSCADLPPSAPSGYYLIRSSSLHVYCDMSRTCGGVTGGWMRVFELDMTITSHQCPNGLSRRIDGSRRTCVRNVSATGCSSIFLPTRNVNYSRVCGRITGYQHGNPDGLYNSGDIDSIYVDGVSLTHGGPPRQHIWTFADSNHVVCPCQGGPAMIPSSVGNDYFCDVGSPLWDEFGCQCCTNPPWFHQQLPQPTSDDIEMRVCRSEPNDDEDIAIQLVEIYVR